MDPREEDLMQKQLRLNQEKADADLKNALETIFKKAFQELTEEDKQFLFARAAYLSRDQKKTYASILADVQKRNEEKVKQDQEAAPKVAPELEDTNPHPSETEEADEGDDDGEDETGTEG